MVCQRDIYCGKSRLRRKFKRRRFIKRQGSKKGKQDGRGPDPARAPSPQLGRDAEGWCSRHKDGSQTDSARSSGYWTGSEDSSDELPLLNADPFADLDFEELDAPLCYDMPFDFLKKTREDEETAGEELFLKRQSPDRGQETNTNFMTCATETLKSGEDIKQGLEAEDLTKDEDDGSSVTADSGMGSQAGESSKETSPEPDLPADHHLAHSEDSSLQADNIACELGEKHGYSVERQLQQREDGMLMYANMLMEEEKEEQDMVIWSKEEVLQMDPKAKEKKADETQVESCQEMATAGCHPSEGSPLMGDEQRQKKKKMPKLLCCTIM